MTTRERRKIFDEEPVLGISPEFSYAQLRQDDLKFCRAMLHAAKAGLEHPPALPKIDDEMDDGEDHR